MSNEYIKPVQHKFAVGDKVRVNGRHNAIYGSIGEIVALIPYTCAVPAYDVRIGDSIVAASEWSLAKISKREAFMRWMLSRISKRRLW